MRILIQRVVSARVTWEDGGTEPMGRGLLCLVGFHPEDHHDLVRPMAEKLVHLRVFEDSGGKMNLSMLDAGAGLMLVPQFTLYADCRKGRRPGFSTAMAPRAAGALFDRFAAACRELAGDVALGRFGADMQVHLVNDGPVTILLDSAEILSSESPRH